MYFLFCLRLITIHSISSESEHKWNKFRILNVKWARSSNKSDCLEALCEEVKCWVHFSCCWRSKTGCCSKGFYSFIIQNVGRKSNTNLIFLFVCSSSLYWYFLSILLAASVIAVEIIGFNVKAEFLIKHFFLFVSWSKSNFGDPWMNIFLMKTDPSCSTWYKENGG